MSVAVAPEAETAGIDLSIGLAAMVAICLAIALRVIYSISLGALLAVLANVLNFKVWRFTISLGKPFEAIDNAIQYALGEYIVANEKVLGLWWHANVKVVHYLADSLAWLGASTLHALGNLTTGTIPKVATTIVRPVATDLRGLRRALTAETRHLEHELVRRAKAIEAELARDFGKAWRGIDYLTGSLPHRIALALRGVEADVGRLDHAVDHVIPRRLTRLEKYLGAGVFTGAVVAALTRVFPWWQCRNVRKVARELCRFPSQLLDDLLGVGIAVLVWSDLCEISRLMATVARKLEPELRLLVVVPNAATSCYPPKFSPIDPPVNAQAPPVPMGAVALDRAAA